jgi:hypothetical protein
MKRREKTLGISAGIGAALAVSAGLMALAGPVSATAKGTTATVWLCRPGLANDPCTASLNTTSISASGARTVQHASVASSSKFDCFYVYPTVSAEPGANANLAVQPAEVGAAITQASRFSQVCRVYAPIYRQRTVAGLLTGLSSAQKASTIAYDSLLSGWDDYLAHYNHGRPIIFLGHSQGAAILINLLESQVDNNPTLRARLVSAIILGGNVQVPAGQIVGGSFQHIPACISLHQTGCVIAYSSFPSQPPANSIFGRAGQGVSLQSGQVASAGQQVLCVNPAALGGGSAPLSPYFPTAGTATTGKRVSTQWVTFPGLYTGTCMSVGGATWLNISARSGDPRPTVTETLGPTWGLHLYDVNLGLGNLVSDVAAQERAYTSSTH